MIFTKDQLLTWIKRNVKDRFLQDILAEGNVILLGTFSKIPGSIWPGWVIKFGEKHWVAVIVDNKQRQYRWYRLKELPDEKDRITTTNFD
jgi:hypothetical protein